MKNIGSSRESYQAPLEFSLQYPEGDIHGVALVYGNDLGYAQTVEELRYKMMRMLKDEQDPRALGNAAIFDTYKYVGGRGKGYETWLKAQEPKLDEAMAAKAEEAAKNPGRKKKGAAPEN